ncbi:MAG: hypothetical protein QF864_07915 [SAR202 cluster bacterium]|jgi:hypothetical protein|nr:hypothetical protein [SAR202 cluster bacterium]|tara:strand:- start:4409 stop:4630 length:222 start_codon:yes stop_codon:yes gene_type:complete
MGNFKPKQPADNPEINDGELLKELNPFLDEITEIAKSLVQDYNQNPPDPEGANIIIEIDQDSSYLEDSGSDKK